MMKAELIVSGFRNDGGQVETKDDGMGGYESKCDGVDTEIKDGTLREDPEFKNAPFFKESGKEIENERSNECPQSRGKINDYKSKKDEEPSKRGEMEEDKLSHSVRPDIKEEEEINRSEIEDDIELEELENYDITNSKAGDNSRNSQWISFGGDKRSMKDHSSIYEDVGSFIKKVRENDAQIRIKDKIEEELKDLDLEMFDSRCVSITHNRNQVEEIDKCWLTFDAFECVSMKGYEDIYDSIDDFINKVWVSQEKRMLEKTIEDELEDIIIS